MGILEALLVLALAPVWVPGAVLVLVLLLALVWVVLVMPVLALVEVALRGTRRSTKGSSATRN